METLGLNYNDCPQSEISHRINLDSKLEKFKLRIKVIEERIMIPVKDITIRGIFQRDIEKMRLKRIISSITEYGWLPNESITLNQDREIIDGQHRIEAAVRMKIDKVPCTVIQFDNKKTEAEFFAHISSFNTGLKLLDHFNARYYQGDPYAVFIYDILDKDPKSLLMNKVQRKGHSGHESRFSLSSITLIINFIGLDMAKTWGRSLEKNLSGKLSINNSEEILTRINNFMDWFYKCFGTDKKRNKIPYKNSCLRAILIFYRLLLKQNFLKTESEIRSSIAKMQMFPFTSEFCRIDYTAKISHLITHFNAHKKNRKVEYSNFNL